MSPRASGRGRLLSALLLVGTIGVLHAAAAMVAGRRAAAPA